MAQPTVRSLKKENEQLKIIPASTQRYYDVRKML